MYKLVIGNRNYSSWSLRAWLYLAASGLEFKTERLSLFSDSWLESIGSVSPAGRVPVLVDGDNTVWDSFAITHYLREREPNALDYPKEPAARTHAMSIVAEMHSGFMSIRGELPQNLKRSDPIDPSSLSESCRLQIKRINTMWRDLRRRYRPAGPWLFGDFSIADVFYAPVALRFHSYGVALSPDAKSFVDAVRGHALIAEWVAEAIQETESIDFIDERVPVDKAPLVLG
ncbi:MAG: glutathione S-transferase family protein [Pseudomonadota bacterium]